MRLVFPPLLRPGDTVAAVSLSWGGAAVFPDRYALGKKRVEELLGLRVVETRHALREPTWLAANPRARAEDWMEAVADPSIKGIFSIIGGDDSVRLAPFVNDEIIRKNPKIFMGYSDTTSGHFMCLKAGLSSFYGPSILGEFAENVACHSYMIEAVRRALFEAGSGPLFPSKEWTGQRLEWAVPQNARIARKMFPNPGPRVLQGQGKVRGALIGGCLDVLEMLRGTALWPGPEMWAGALLFLETSEENPSPEVFRRWIRGYESMGILNKVNGILFGRPMRSPEEAAVYDNILVSVVRDECGYEMLPIISQLDFGHSDPKFVIPYGRLAEVDCETATLTLL